MKSKKSVKKYILNISGIAGFLVLWQFLLWIGVLDARYMPSPFEIVHTFITKLYSPKPDGAVLAQHIWASFQVALIGFLIANVVGITLGTLMGWYRPLDLFFRPLFELIRPISPIAWIPLMILWLGIGMKAKAFIIFFSAFVPCVINSYTGVQNTPQTLIQVAKTCGAPSFRIFRKVAIPYSLPMIFAGVRISLNNAWATLVGAEMLSSNEGLGYMILQGRQFSRADIIIVGMITIGLVGALISAVLSAVERKVLKGRM